MSVGYLNDPQCDPGGFHVQLFPNFFDGSPGALHIQLHLATEEHLGSQSSQYHIGIRNGGDIAFAVAGWSGISACAFRANTQCATGVDTCNRSATGTNGVDIEHRQVDGVPADDGFSRM